MAKLNTIKDTSPKKRNYERWSVSERSGKLTKDITVKEAENGFVIEINEYGEDAKGHYFDDTKTYLSKSNPLAPKEEASTMSKLQKSIEEMDKGFGRGKTPDE